MVKSPITAQFRREAELAFTYSEDGAFHSAARVMAQVAARMKDHAERVLGPAPPSRAVTQDPFHPDNQPGGKNFR